MPDSPDWSWWQEEDTAKVYDYLRDQLSAINKLPYKKRAGYIAHQVRCSNSKCQDVVIQVIDLRLPTDQPVRVMRYRTTELDSLPVGIDPGQRARAMAKKRSFRLGEWMFYIITDGEPNRGNIIFTVCGCGQHTFTEPGILSRKGPTSTNTPTAGH
jgi:hypothetical protein